MNEAQIRRARVHAQLLGDHPHLSVSEIVRQVVGIQAQNLGAAAMSIRARSPDLVLADVQKAVEARSIVLTWSLRGTRHFHNAEDVAWLVGLFGPRYSRPGRRFEQLGIAGAEGDRAVTALQVALRDAGVLSRAEVKEVFAATGVDVSGQPPIHLVRRAALEGILCVVPGAHGQDSYALLETWAPAASSSDPARAAALLATRYLRAYRPSTPKDFQVWSGLPAGLARQGWEGIAADLEEVGGPEGSYWVLAQSPSTPNTEEPAPVRMTGAFDTLLLGYADRRIHLAKEHTKLVNAGGGLIKPVVYEDGEVVATWRYVRARPRGGIEVTPLRPLSRRADAGIARESDAIRTFLAGTEPSVQNDQPRRLGISPEPPHSRQTPLDQLLSCGN